MHRLSALVVAERENSLRKRELNYIKLYEISAFCLSLNKLFDQIMAGLLDQYLLAGSRDALDMVVDMTNYFYKRVKSVIEDFTIERHWRSLNEETGGMNDVLYRIYTVTVSPLVGLYEGYERFASDFLT